ncbi:ubiquitin-protein ligase E3 RBBP6 family involved in mRNA cleavage (predicted) [Reticulomyxa filosa]|uniref:Ubiquitin-protein ligase E3 RBBP6 family involved in mRNA cleavage (Predicted) n=1 Tax=Reticulomyxa filosa TaxID=46433 RepID=X6NMB3_RETFI|nr:ubiquitin-protein ligase E3 RBBP6 family involved in mRNA cleavage (predicted) [Reticulomyxa filosa]|eukprot:ETO27375.1 ubiquitin-protein ligase E3 RBBP6 family involved in mRNA cleavage (predicted) [Reticulomyxa filosa]
MDNQGDSQDFSKPPPTGYICHRCNQPGHWIKACPTNGNPVFDKPGQDFCLFLNQITCIVIQACSRLCVTIDIFFLADKHWWSTNNVFGGKSWNKNPLSSFLICQREERSNVRNKKIQIYVLNVWFFFEFSRISNVSVVISLSLFFVYASKFFLTNSIYEINLIISRSVKNWLKCLQNSSASFKN